MKRSGWLITVNTNQRFPSPEAAKPFMLGLQAAMREVLSNLEKYVLFAPAGHKWGPDLILAAKARQGVEFGPVNHLVHTHSLVQIQHRSRIRLDYAAIKRDVASYMVERYPDWMTYSNGEAKRLYFNFKSFTPSGQLADYVRKDQAQRRELGIGDDSDIDDEDFRTSSSQTPREDRPRL